jgi:pyruvate dehydrogenase E2 component (dihydrolipoamide acetyltransferase)
MGADQVKAMFEAGTYEEVPLDGMRKTIAKRLVESKQTVPHFYLSLDCELDALMALREQINAAAGKDKDGKPAYKLSVNDFVIKALAIALQRVPAANAVWAEDRILKMKHSDVGVGCRHRGWPLHPGGAQSRAEDPHGHLGRGEGHGGPRPQPAPEARGIPGRLHGGLEPRHVRHQELPGGHQPAPGHDPGGRRRRTARCGEERRSRRHPGHDRDALLRPPASVDGALGAELLAAFKQLIESPMGMLV